MRTVFLSVLLSLLIALPALADRDDRDGGRDRDRDRGHEVHGAPGPIAGAGLPVLALGGGIYWIVRRVRRKKQDRQTPPEPSTE
jgi:hypothetical protein